MARIASDQLFSLIRSLNKNEKRYFKIMMSALAGKEDKKMILLFDVINGQKVYDEKNILERVPVIRPGQLPNQKAYLQEKLLQSLRQFSAGSSADIRIREQIDYAQLLFERRLFKTGMNCLRKAKKLAEAYEKLELLLEIIRLEKTVILDTIDIENIDKVDFIITEVQKINAQINNINIFSNLSLKLDYYFTKIGSVRNEKDFIDIEHFFRTNLPEVREEELSVNEKIHYYNLFVAYYYYTQDYEKNYLYSKRLTELFHQVPSLASYRAESFIKSLNLILVAQYRLFKYREFTETLEELKHLLSESSIYNNENLKVRVMKYIYMHEINLFFMRGDFTKGADQLVNKHQIEVFLRKTDRHSQLIFNYKIACLYFGAGNFSMAVKWLQKIINEPHSGIGEDLHCFARIINLISHYELENFEVINYFIISTYRFLFKKEDLHLFQKYIIAFLRKLAGSVSNKELMAMFAELKVQLLPLLHSRFDGRAFYYFDIISWLESKIEKLPVEEIVQRKFLAKVKV
jgi:hypothetical protein